MKQIEDKKIVTSGEQKIKGTYFELCRMILEFVQPGEGLNIKNIRVRNRTLDRFDSAKDGIANLEDADFDVLYSAMETFQWGIVSKEVEEFVDYLDEVKKQE